MAGGFGAGAGMISDIWGMGNSFNQMAQSQNLKNDLRQAYSQFKGLKDLDPQALKVAAQQMGIQPDVLASQVRQDQLNALRQMQNIANTGGMDNQAVAGMQQAGAQAAQQNQANQASIQNRLQRQGMDPGAGAGIAASQSAAQSGYNTLAMAGAQNAANAQARALQAINASGRLAGDIASQDEARQRENNEQAAARDRYNTGVRQAASQFNSGAMQNAAGYNLNRRSAQMNAASQMASGVNRQIDQSTKQSEKAGEYFQDLGDNMDSFAGGSMGGGKK